MIKLKCEKQLKMLAFLFRLYNNFLLPAELGVEPESGRNTKELRKQFRL